MCVGAANDIGAHLRGYFLGKFQICILFRPAMLQDARYAVCVACRNSCDPMRVAL